MRRRGVTQVAPSTGRQRGYSLTELLLVLAILAALTTLAIPALRRPLQRARLRGGVREVQAALARTRSLAIRSGRAHSLRYQAGGTEFHIETVDETTAAQTTPSGLNIDGTQVQSASTPRIVRRFELATGVRFEDSRPSPFDDPARSEASLTLAPPDLIGPGALSEDGPAGRANASDLVTFLPNGRTQDAVIRLVDSRDRITEIQLRGLTGLTRVRTVPPSADRVRETVEADPRDPLQDPLQ